MTPANKIPRRPSARNVLHPDTPPWILRAVVFGLAAWWISLAVVSVVGQLRTLIVTIAASFVIACALEIPTNALVRRGVRRSVAAGSLIFVIVVAALALAGSVGAMVAGQVAHLVHHLPATITSVVALINNWTGLHLHAATYIKDFHHLNFSSSKGSSLSHSSKSALAALGGVAVGGFVTFYMVADGPRFRSFVCSLLRPSSQPEVLRAWELAIEKTGGYFISRFILAAIRMAIVIPALLVIGVPYAVALGVWFGLISEIVPIIGTALASALPLLVALDASPHKALAVLICVTVVTQVRNFVLAPKLTRRAVNVHPTVTFVAVLAAVKVVGPVGSLLAVPFVATAQAFVSSYVNRHQVSEESALLSDHHLRPSRPKSAR